MSRRLIVPLLLALLMMAAGPPAAAAELPPLRFPVDGDDVAFTNDFGIVAKERVHQGIDLFAPKGAEVVAVSDGFVIRMQAGERAGYYLVIRHGDGWESWYLHLNDDRLPGIARLRSGSPAFAPGIEIGQFVAAGTLIGWVGDSGNAAGTDPHLHFELRRRGTPTNPYRQLAAAWERLELGRAIDAGTTPFR